eukprot:499610_1
MESTAAPNFESNIRNSFITFDDAFQFTVTRLRSAPGADGSEEFSEFGSVYTGQSLRCIVSVTSIFQAALADVDLRIDINYGAQTIPLVNSRVEGQFESGACREFLVTQSISQSGEHSLLCNITFSYRSERRKVQNVYTFGVDRALDMSLRSRSVETVNFVEARITNLLPEPLILSTVTFNPSEGFECLDENSTEDGQSLFGPSPTLKPKGICSFLFQLKSTNGNAPVMSKSFGSVAVLWQSVGAEGGRSVSDVIPTSLTRTGSTLPPDISLTVVRSPARVKLEEPFDSVFEVTNNSAHAREIVVGIAKDRMMSIMPYRTYHQSLGVIQPHCSAQLTYSFLPVATGIHSITGLVASCPEIKSAEWSFDNIHDVCVVIGE